MEPCMSLPGGGGATRTTTQAEKMDEDLSAPVEPRLEDLVLL